MLEGIKITHYTFKETLPFWRKKDQAVVHRQKEKTKKQTKTACKNCPPELKKVQSDLLPKANHLSQSNLQNPK